MWSSSWKNHTVLFDVYKSAWYRYQAKLARAAYGGNVTKEQLLDWGVPEVEVEALLENVSNFKDKYEARRLSIETAFMKLNKTERIKIGHNASIFLHDATFSGKCSCIPVSHA